MTPETLVNIELELQIASAAKTLPHPAQVREWVSVALWGRIDTAELTIRIVDESESAELNKQYRGKIGPTNVLSFPYEPYPGIASRLLGDVVLCAPIIEREAVENNKELIAHWAHLVVHGTLHLLGYNHELAEEAVEMESLETAIMLQLGFSPPYGDSIGS
jgi:probable rRNA maturation factor